MPVRIYLDGVLVTGRVDGTEGISLSIRRKAAKGEFTKNVSTELTFYGDGYERIKAALLGVGSSVASSIPCMIQDDCCNFAVFEGIIRADSIDFCTDECWIRCNVIQDDDESRALTCIQSTLITDNTHNSYFPSGIDSVQHPFMRYCIETRPDLIAWAILLFGAIINITLYLLIPLFAVVTLIIAFVSVLCQIVNVILAILLQDPLDCPDVDGPGTVSYFLDFIEYINEYIIGCGRFHPSPKVRDYISNVCAICGIQFSSNIFNNPLSPYYSSVYFNAPIQKGHDRTQTFPTVNQIGDNKPVHTLETFLDELKQPFNAEWELRDGVLYFERRDFFAPQTIWFNTVTGKDRLLNGPCFTYKSNPLPAYLDIIYQRDGFDIAGNEAIFARFKDIVEWNDPPEPSQSGALKVDLPYGAVRARNDGLELDVLSQAQLIPGLDFGFYGNLSESERYMILPQHVTFLPKLLIWDGENLTKGLIERDYVSINTGYPSWSNNVTITGVSAAVDKRLNYPYWLQEDAPGTLIPEFWAFENPRNPDNLQKQFDINMTIRYDCALLNSFDMQGGVGVAFRGELKIARIVDIDIDLNAQTMKIKAEL